MHLAKHNDVEPRYHKLLELKYSINENFILFTAKISILSMLRYFSMKVFG